MKIEKKIWSEYFEKILDGSKNFELRLADWECEAGDVLVLNEWDPEIKEYTGRSVEKRVGYVIKTKDIDFWPEEDVQKFGYQIISLK